MANSIDVNLLSKEVMEYLENYVEDIEEQVETVTNEVCKDAVKELKEKSPREKGKRKKPYYKGWRIKKDKLGGKIYKVKILYSIKGCLWIQQAGTMNAPCLQNRGITGDRREALLHSLLQQHAIQRFP